MVAETFGQEDIVTPLTGLKQQKAASFDCDSMLALIEGIDELGEAKGVGEQIRAMTRRAMEEGWNFGQALAARLSLIQPTRQEIEALGARYVATQVPGIKSLIENLQQDGVTPIIVSGGFRDAILPLAQELGVNDENVLAIQLLFAENGEYQGIDTEDPVTAALIHPNGNGKARVLELWENRNPYINVRVHSGDGMTDIEVRNAGTRERIQALGFGGVVARDTVRAAADGFYENVADLQNAIRAQLGLPSLEEESLVA